MKIVTISTSGQIEEREITENGKPLYSIVRSIVDGYMENVYPMRLDKSLIMIVNEEGLLMNLPTNPIASYLYGTDIHGQPIVGDVAILKSGFFEGEPDIVGIPDNETQKILDDLNYIKAYILKGAK